MYFKKIRNLISIFLVLVLSISLLGCSFAKPETSVQGFFDSIKATNLKSAETYLVKTDSMNKDTLKFDSEEQKVMIEAIMSKVSYEIISTDKKRNSATVKVKVTSEDLVSVISKAMPEMLSMAFTTAFSENADDPGRQDKAIEQLLINKINDPNAPLTTTNIDVHLIKSGDTWLIQSDENLMNAITGNIAKAFEFLNSNTIN